MSSSVPPLFGDFGKSCRDLFKKRYDFEHKFKSVRKATGGVSVEYGAVVEKGQLRGFIKDTWEKPKYTVEGEISTDAAVNARASVKSSKLYPGLTAEARVDSRSSDSALKGTVYSDEVSYKRENVSVSAELKSDLSTHKVKSSLSVGFEGINVGGAMSLTMNSGSGVQVDDYNVGFEVTRAAHTLSLTTEKKLDNLNVLYFNRADRDTAVGAALKVELTGNRNTTFTLGNEYAVDSSSTLKAKVEFPSGQTTVALDHRLKDPSVSFSMVAAFTPLSFAKEVKADKFGFGVTIGDY